MRAVTIVAAGAALLGTASAAPSWADWSSSSSDPVAAETTKTTTTTTPAAETTTTSHTWEDWTTTRSDPVEIATTTTTTTPSTPADETTSTTTHTWEDWTTTTTTSSDPVEITSTSTTSTTTHVWEDWTTTSSDPVEITTTTTSTTTHTWEDWTTTTPSSTPVEITSTTYDPTHTWADWESSSSPVEITSTSSEDPSHTWADWESSIELTSTVVESGTTTTTVYLGKPTDPVPADLASTSTEATTTWADWTESTSSPAPAWSSDGWFGPGWDPVSGQCAPQVVTSYGSPIWEPTPDASLPVLSVIVSPTAPAEETTTSESTTWADWTPSSSEPVVETTSSAEWSYSAPAEETPTSSAGWPSNPTGGLGDSEGKTWGLTYSPYTNEGGCKDAGTVAKDLAIIAGKGFSTVRVYSTDCDTLENVGNSARDNGLKIILGVFISSTGIEGSKEQVWDIIGWAQWDLVELIVVGNEAVFNGYATAGGLAAYIAESAAFFKAAGYTGPVTTTEPLAEWTKEGSTFCGSIDVVAANLYAFFNAEVTPDKAGDFIQRQIKELEVVCPGKATYLMESGWPSAGNCNGVACPSKENQATAIKSIQSVTGSTVIFFSYEDEAWKAPGEFNVEQHWGCADVF